MSSSSSTSPPTTMPPTPTTPFSDASSSTDPNASPAPYLPPGVYVPIPAFFTPTDDTVDIPATQRHVARLLASGIAGLVVHGSNGEAVHLSHAERLAALRAVADTVRHTTDALHAPVPIIAGCSAASVRETVELCREAKEAGATHALVLAPGYYKGLVEKDGGKVVEGYFGEVARGSPIPVVVYNFPAAANGVDLDSDLLVRLARGYRGKIVGVKLTCGNTGKLARVVADAGEEFFVAGGSADFILQGLVVGARGTISGLANLCPRACVRIGELWEQGRVEEARRLQQEVARADWLAIQAGFVGVKAAIPMFFGETEASCAVPRAPFKRLEDGGEEMRRIREGMAGALEIEKKLTLEAGEN